MSRDLDPWISEWGNPVYSDVHYSIYRERTRGSETSQYPQEKKSKEILLVAASERGLGRLDLAYLLEEHFGKSEQRR